MYTDFLQFAVVCVMSNFINFKAEAKQV